jgi:hypothetical protein
MFLRFQEHYESPEFGGTVFTLEDYKNWYKDYYKLDIFTYYQDWSGFNVPSWVVETFRNGWFDPITPQEAFVLGVTAGLEGRYYVIGTCMGSEGLQHELCHGLYYTNPSYKREVNEQLANFDTSQVEDFVRSHGYHEEVVMDECHAYLAADSGYLSENNVDFSPDLVKNLKKIRKKYGVT